MCAWNNLLHLAINFFGKRGKYYSQFLYFRNYLYLILYFQIFIWIASSAQRGEMINELWKSCGSCESYFSVLDKQKGTFAPAMEFFTKKGRWSLFIIILSTTCSSRMNFVHILMNIYNWMTGRFFSHQKREVHLICPININNIAANKIIFSKNICR